MKRIIGLDLGTNSIGWASILYDEKNGVYHEPGIERAGVRIIPMDAAILGDFDKGNTTSQTSDRTKMRGVRRLRERHLLRRERLHKVLRVLDFLPEHYLRQLDTGKRSGKFLSGTEPKLAWRMGVNGKSEFLFRDSFEEMLSDFASHQPDLLSGNKKIPYDWTIYYLRKKALKQKIAKEELAWLLLHFNQKRGYYQLREEEQEENENKLVEFHALRVVDVKKSGEKKGKEDWYDVCLENGWVYRRSSRIPLDNWVGQVKEFIVTTELEADGTPKLDKEGEVKRSFRAPKDDDWTLVKKKTEREVEMSGQTVGGYIYETLLRDPRQKIRGKLIRTIERKYYKEELRAILKTQVQFHEELRDLNLYKDCVSVLYPSNEAYRANLEKRGFVSLFLDDILFYQRPLKSKKSQISNCPYEFHEFADKETGEVKHVPLKCIPKSHPLFQEFRLWQFISNLKIYQREKRVGERLCTDVDVTKEFLVTEDDYVKLFDWLSERKEVDQKALLKNPFWGLKNRYAEYRWNYVEDKVYPCNPTRAAMITQLKKLNIPFIGGQEEEHLWHILYSVNDRVELEKALGKFAVRYSLPENEFVEALKKMPPFEKEYGAYSLKAIKKLLALMRRGTYWNEDAIDVCTRERIKQIVAGDCDEQIQRKLQEQSISLQDISGFKGLPVWLACYVVYGRHSEAKEIEKWNSPEDIEFYLKSFKQHSLRNPIVEQIVLETLRVVRDIWKQVGIIDEIHVELGREMKHTAEERRKISLKNLENENTNARIKALLIEFMNPEYGIENIRPYSPSQQEILRIYEETVLNDVAEIPEDITGFLKKMKGTEMPTKSEFMRYKLWLEQKYCSPYTGEVIPLSRLFTPDYEIEHIIPQSRYFDDSFSNKVICESAVNRLKDNQLGYEFIKNNPGRKVDVGFGKSVEIFSVEAYERFVSEHYAQSSSKKKKLLMEDIPEQFIERQLNDSRYISKLIVGLLSNIVRDKDEYGNYENQVISKNVVVCSGGVTDRLKKDWGLHDVWNDIVTPRFERLNQLTGTEEYGHWECKDGKRFFRTSLPFQLQRGFNKKRIDHRHHAMDAIVIACATRNHVNYLNNESASKAAKVSRYDLQRLLCEKAIDGDRKKILKKPWAVFPKDVKEVLENIIVSFKQNLRVINATTNYYSHFDKNGKKVIDRQSKGESWAIRKPLHKDTVFGRVNLRKVKEVRLSIALENPSMIVNKALKFKIKELFTYASYRENKKLVEKYFKEHVSEWKGVDFSKIAIYYYTDTSTEPLVATRKPLDTSFTVKKIKESVTDTGIQRILLKFLQSKGDDPQLAFSPEGVEEMNKNLDMLNGGKKHQPIYKVRVYEPLGNKFPVGETGNKGTKYVEAAKGTNLFFAVYLKSDGMRTFETIPLSLVIEREKQGFVSVPEVNGNGDKLLFWLTPNDLVYLPTEDELETGKINSLLDTTRIYKMVSATGNRSFFIPQQVANVIVPSVEFESLNKVERAITGEIIKNICVPLKVNRIGNICSIGILE